MGRTVEEALRGARSGEPAHRAQAARVSQSGDQADQFRMEKRIAPFDASIEDRVSSTITASPLPLQRELSLETLLDRRLEFVHPRIVFLVDDVS